MRALTTLRVRNPGVVAVGTPGTAEASSATWTSFTPRLTAATTNPSMGTGATTFLGEIFSTQAAYMKLGDITVVRYILVFGTGATAGSGLYSVGLPIGLPIVYGFDPTQFTSRWTTHWPIIGEGRIYSSVDDSVSYVQCWADQATNTTFALRTIGTSSVPFAGAGIGVGSFIEVELFYPTAGYDLSLSELPPPPAYDDTAPARTATTTATAFDATILTSNAHPTRALVTVSGYNATITTSNAVAGLASVTVTARNATVSTVRTDVNAGLASTTVTAFDATATYSTNVQAERALVTVTANNAHGSILVSAGVSTETTTANDAISSTMLVGAAQVTITAYGATTTIAASAGLATVACSSFNATVSLTTYIAAGAATVTITAYNGHGSIAPTPTAAEPSTTFSYILLESGDALLTENAGYFLLTGTAHDATVHVTDAPPGTANSNNARVDIGAFNATTTS